MTASIDLRPLLTRRDIAGVLRVSVRTVDRLVRRGRLRPVRVGSRVQFRAEDVERLVQPEASVSRPAHEGEFEWR